MRRRDLLQGAAAGGLLSAFAVGLPALAKVGARRVRPTDPAWPGEEAWEDLKSALGGRLIKPPSLTAACDADASSAACTALYKDLVNPYYIGDQPTGTQVSGWLDAWTPRLSAYVVAAESTADIVEAVKFARAHNLRLVIKGGAHSYQGGSNAPDSLLVWTRRMNAITLHDGFMPQGAAGAPVPAVSIGAGAMWADAYDAVTTKAGRYVQGGGCATVGVAGLVLGGGFGSFSKQYGLAAASLLEAEIVTADGSARVVNADRDPDLFWALKGGGQSAFGVVTRVTLKTHPLADTAGAFRATIKASSSAAFRRLLGAFVDLYADHLFNPHWGESVNITPDNEIKVSMVFQGLTADEAISAWKPLTDFASASGAEFSFDGPHALAEPMRRLWDFAAMRQAGLPFARYDRRLGAPADHAWWAGDAEQVSMFIHGYDSLWLPASLLARDGRARLADGLFAASRRHEVALHFNKGLGGAPPEVIDDSRATATNPAVLDAFALAIIAGGGAPDFPGYPRHDLSADRKDAESIAAATAALRPLAPGGGSYISESNYFNDDWRQAFWGENYARLARVKAKYDPEGLFFLRHGVGSEGWSGDGFTRLS